MRPFLNLNAQGNKQSAFAFNYNYQIPIGKLANTYGDNSAVGASYFLETSNNVIFGIEASYMFGADIKNSSIFNKNSKFIKINKINKSIGTGSVINTNNCEISVCESRVKNKLVIFSAIDNLIKGASGQAIQNMNIMYNFKENEGLK